MKKPFFATTIRIAGFDYDIYFDEIKADRKSKLYKDFELVGKCDFESRKITIDAKNCTDEEVYSTLFHELIHATLESLLIDYNVKDVQDDRFVHPFSRILWDAMINAGLINKRWEKGKAKK